MKILFLTLALMSSSLMAETIQEIVKPVERSTGQPLSSESSMNGVCRYLGFDKALRNSTRLVVDYYIYYGPNRVVPVYLKGDTIAIDEYGMFEYNTIGNIIYSIKCIKS